MITEDEVQKLVGSLKNSRDRALTYTLYDSGCRIGELLTLRNKDIAFDEYGGILSVTGKTGYRKVRIVGNSISYLREWQNSHPSRDDPNAWYFCGIESENRGKKLEHANVYKFMRKGLREAKIERRIYPHLFRHTRATILASRVTEAPLEAQMGWVHGSRMTQTYVHLSGRDQDNAILKAYGLEVKEERPIESQKPSLCPRCREPNDPKARFCWKCGMILDQSLTEKKLKEEAKEIETAIMKSDVVDTPTKMIVETFPDDFKDVRKLSSSGKILVIPWTSDSDEKEAEYSSMFYDYFSQCGFDDVLLLAKSDSENEIQRKFSEVDVIYLPGGDTEVIYRELKQRTLQDRLLEFSGVIIGNSAGAIVLTKGGWGDGKFYKGFGLVDFYISVHYKLDAGHIAETKAAINVNIPENMWITVTCEK